MYSRAVSVQMLPHGRVVPEHLCAALKKNSETQLVDKLVLIKQVLSATVHTFKMLSYPEYFLKRWPWKEHPLYLFLKKQYKKTNHLKSWAKNPNLNPIPNNNKKIPKPFPHSVLWAMYSQMNRTVSWRRCSSDRSKWINQTKVLNRFQRKKAKQKSNQKKPKDRRRAHGYLWYTLQSVISKNYSTTMYYIVSNIPQIIP